MLFGGFVRDDVFDIGNCGDLGLEDSQGDISQIFARDAKHDVYVDGAVVVIIDINIY